MLRQVQHRALEGLHISSLAVEPRSGVTFAGTHNGGLYASRDGAKTWQKSGTGIAEEQVYSLAVAQAGGQARVVLPGEPGYEDD